MAKVLLYNFNHEGRRKKVKSVLFQYGVPSREVPPEEQHRTLGALLGLETSEPEDAAESVSFDEEMIVMHDLTPRQFHGFLDGIRRLGIAVPLKAVVTGHNIGWTSRRLRDELRAEHEAMNRGAKGIHEP